MDTRSPPVCVILATPIFGGTRDFFFTGHHGSVLTRPYAISGIDTGPLRLPRFFLIIINWVRKTGSDQLRFSSFSTRQIPIFDQCRSICRIRIVVA